VEGHAGLANQEPCRLTPKILNAGGSYEGQLLHLPTCAIARAAGMHPVYRKWL
jgi:hypothetical protein